MKIKVLYYELQEKEFRSKKTLNAFLRKHLDCEILRAIEYKKGFCHAIELKSFIQENKYETQRHRTLTKSIDKEI